MPRRRSLVSDEVKYEIARELGFANKIRRSGDSYDYGDITSREAGLIVRGLIEKAERAMADQLKREKGR
ncbi:MAG: small, acid-soluble spore protein, alpha/beta type [Bacillota bacterium]|jgi:small acid-soluble spore protein F (minor alpha/beta-type SASP)|nr:small, acid-soluble spore protein, alpha/beta type [Bacillota bacterium]